MITVENDIAVSGDVRVAVIGVGGAGCRIASMLYGKMSRVGVIAINTDRKALEETSADVRLYICKEVTKGLGTNGDPALGKKCAQIHEAEITSAVSKYDYAYVEAGMGGGTGSGAASVVAELCDRAGGKVGAVAIMPFSFESGRAVKAADGFRALHAICSDIVKVENDKVLSVPGIGSFDEAMGLLNSTIVKTINNAVEDSKAIVRNDIARHMDDSSDGSDVVSVTPRIAGTGKSH